MTADEKRVMADDNLAAEMLELIQIVVKHIASRLEQVGLTTTDYFTLQALDNPMPMSELAERMNYDPSYVTALADRLGVLDLVERQAHTTDRRVRNLVLTDKGRELRESLPETLWKDSGVFSSLDSGEHAALMELTKKVRSSHSP
jgi:DNA-binding MarR family transcriptional regulator